MAKGIGVHRGVMISSHTVLKILKIQNVMSQSPVWLCMHIFLSHIFISLELFIVPKKVHRYIGSFFVFPLPGNLKKLLFL